MTGVAVALKFVYVVKKSLTWAERSFTMLEKRGNRNYLSRLYFDQHSEDYQYRRVNLVARAIYPARGVKSFATLQVRVVSLSETGAILQASNIKLLPDHFYLCLGKFEIFLTCAKVKDENGSMFVSFSRKEETSFIEALSLIAFPLDTLQQLQGNCSRAIEARIDRSPKSN